MILAAGSVSVFFFNLIKDGIWMLSGNDFVWMCVLISQMIINCQHSEPSDSRNL